MVNKDDNGKDNIMREEEIVSFEEFLERRAPLCNPETARLLWATWNTAVDSACQYLRVTHDYGAEEGLTEQAVKSDAL